MAKEGDSQGINRREFLRKSARMGAGALLVGSTGNIIRGIIYDKDPAELAKKRFPIDEKVRTRAVEVRDKFYSSIDHAVDSGNAGEIQQLATQQQLDAVQKARAELADIDNQQQKQIKEQGRLNTGNISPLVRNGFAAIAGELGLLLFRKKRKLNLPESKTQAVPKAPEPAI